MNRSFRFIQRGVVAALDGTTILLAALPAVSQAQTITRTGSDALLNNTTGTANTADGYYALYKNTIGGANTAVGLNALYYNSSGSYNTAVGVSALQSNTTGTNNTATQNNTAGSNSIAIGYAAGNSLTAGSNNIDIGNTGVGGDSSFIRIGQNQTHTFITGIAGASVGTTAKYVVINTNGQLGTVNTTITSINPAKLNAALARLEERDAKLEAIVISQGAVIAAEEKPTASRDQISVRQQEEIKALTATVKEQSALLQNVSAQIVVSRPAPQVVSNNN